MSVAKTYRTKSEQFLALKELVLNITAQVEIHLFIL